MDCGKFRLWVLLRRLGLGLGTACEVEQQGERTCRRMSTRMPIHFLLL